ncbi:hypothetical protein [Paractinoplanes rishiriensis]|nr:hypothetical protein [Actinoplanes rishiriensis]
MPPATAAAASGSRSGEPVTDSAPSPITRVSDGTTGRNPSAATAAKTIT